MMFSRRGFENVNKEILTVYFILTFMVIATGILAENRLTKSL